ncbi:Tex family protein [Alteromonas facilis]|uniref:Tex family protein n=1 Tax=Alteromonas facilis TaxID=2048004 RepID=UPI000C28CF0E|nr:Tex family protein [Alteromonas facilis]
MLINKIATELGVEAERVQSAVELLDGGATVPFIARYRKEATKGLDDTQLRFLEQRLGYLRELEDRRSVILKSIDEQEKLTPELKAKILQADSKTLLEDLYLPYKPKRRTKGQIAIEAGLEPLADKLYNDRKLDPDTTAQDFVSVEKNVADVKAALEGAKFILIERFAEDAELLAKLRQYLEKEAHISSQVVAGKETEGAKFKDYFSHSEKITTTPSHRALAMFRGRNEGVLQLKLNADPQQESNQRHSHCEILIAQHLGFQHRNAAADDWLNQVIQWTWRIKLQLHLETELFAALRERAETSAIDVFANNLKDLLMAAPAGRKVTMGLDPGLRTGVKLAIVDTTGKVIHTTTIFPHAPQNQWDKSMRSLETLCKQFKVELISIGNGTGSRETDQLVAEMITKSALPVQKIMVSEAGASVYSASALASNELPELDVSLRGAVSIARRLQDPLAELVKIEPKAIGVGQYQHDVSQSHLAKALDNTIEDCVNAVGVDLNTASPALLSYVSGLNKTLASNIVAYRDQNGGFADRSQLLSVERLGPKAFEQAAGFLRIVNGSNPLDASAVHPEAYPVVDKIIDITKSAVNDVIANSDILRSLDLQSLVDAQFGLPTVKDIVEELKKPGRDPRPEFKTAKFKAGINTINDLKEGMILEGVVTNVANFGAFVDVGVHQDGLVHISALTNKFIKDPREVVKAGDIVRVKVLDVDVQRKRIAFTMRLDDKAESKPQASKRDNAPRPKRQSNAPSTANAAMGNAFADAFAKAKKS